MNNDGQDDIALLKDTPVGRELIALMRTKDGYKTYVVAKNVGNMRLACRKGSEVEQSEAVDGGRLQHKTLGAYVELKQPEGASVAYYWNGSGFSEVWTSD